MSSVLVVEPFAVDSHRAWAEGWRSHSRHHIELVTLPPVAWRWRMHGGAVTVAEEIGDRLAAGYRPDLIVASDMIDLAALLALVRRDLPDVAVALYLHENQLTYPRRPGEPLDRGLAWLTWKNLVVADAVWCNSAFHRDDLLGALPGLLDAVPVDDHRHLLPVVAGRMEVLPVPLAGLDELITAGAAGRPAGSGRPLVVSNQRWHHDKDVGAVLRALCRLATEGVDVDLALLGDHEGGEADAVRPLIDELGDRVRVAGRQDEEAYRRWLLQGDVVVSAAHHEFFGVAVVEAVAAGCVPVLPRALAYPETIPTRFHSATLFEPGGLTSALRATLTDLPGRRAATEGLARSMGVFDAAAVVPRYDAAVDRLLAEAPGGPD